VRVYVFILLFVRTFCVCVCVCVVGGRGMGGGGVCFYVCECLRVFACVCLCLCACVYMCVCRRRNRPRAHTTPLTLLRSPPAQGSLVRANVLGARYSPSAMRLLHAILPSCMRAPLLCTCTKSEQTGQVGQKRHTVILDTRLTVVLCVACVSMNQENRGTHLSSRHEMGMRHTKSMLRVASSAIFAAWYSRLEDE